MSAPAQTAQAVGAAQPVAVTRIDACVCTYRRASLEAALTSLDAQQLPGGVRLRIVVADNDETPSAAPLVARLAADLATPVRYVHAPARNISIARNACLDAAEGDWVAFLDDDEHAPPDWLAKLLAAARADDLDCVFGPALAEYGSDAPEWIVARGYHSNIPVRRWGEVQTGHTCNALVRRTPAIAGERFLLEKGRTGGEDTEFFFRLWRAGARMGLAEDAPVYEPVDPARLTFEWIAKRKLRAGQTYGRHSLRRPGALARAGLVAGAAAKVGACGLAAAATAFSRTRRNYWLLRGVFHLGVFSVAARAKEAELY